MSGTPGSVAFLGAAEDVFEVHLLANWATCVVKLPVVIDADQDGTG